MKGLWMSGAAAAMAMSIASIGAQTPQTQQPSTAVQTMTVQGCVYQEKDIPGRTPNVAERAGMLEDYILVTTAPTAGAAGTTGTTRPPTAGAAGMPHAGKAFKLEQVADEQLKAMVGKRVEVTGRVDKETATGTAGKADPMEFPEFEVTSIKEIEGTCPAVPEIKK